MLELYIRCRTCEEHGYTYGNSYCAHLIGNFNHKMHYGLEDVNFARPENHTPMSAPTPNGEARFWVLEIHLLQDPAIGTCDPICKSLTPC